MATLKTLKTSVSDRFVDRYRGRTSVYLEGNHDFQMYENYWFNEYLDRLEFKTPGQPDGCKMVIAKVAEERQAGIRAYGIVDRDTVQSDDQWHFVWETNDELFLKARPFGEYVRVTLLWELESYLINPEVIEEYLAPSAGGRALRPTHAVLSDLLAHADALIPHAALNAALHELRDQNPGKTKCSDGYTFNLTRERVEQKIESDYRATLGDEGWTIYRQNIQKVEAFDYPAESPEKRLLGLLRRVHGKGFIERIKNDAKIQHNICYHLGMALKRRGLPAELVGYIEEFCGVSP